ncbi:MAG: AMP-binding protein [Burkholderiaceae bacterium]
MSTLVDRILACAPTQHALRGPWGELSQAMMADAVAALAERLRQERIRVLATLLDNGPAWVLIDLATMRAGVTHVPLAGFQTPEQWQHIIEASGADAAICAQTFMPWTASPLSIQGEQLQLMRRSCDPRIGKGIAKLSFTSGSTGTPKGIQLREAEMLAVATSIADALGPMPIELHQCLLPLAVLLENVTGIYAPLLAGAAIDLRPCATLGLQGASAFAPQMLDTVIRENAAQSLILLPQMLRAWTGWLARQRRQAPGSLRFVAVGGAPVGAGNLARARALGLPAYEGYGLTEGASVQTLNLPGGDRPGSAGRALAHCRVRCRDDGEIEIAGSLALGEVGSPPPANDAWLPTGDLGSIDDDGFVWIDGRKKNLFITGFGRNVAPEWVESALENHPALAPVFGEGLQAPVVWTFLARQPSMMR